MTPEAQLAAITALGGVLIAAIAAIAAHFNRKINKIEVNVDGRLSQLLEVSKDLARAQGIVEGTDTERQRVRDARAERAEEKVTDVAAVSLAEDTAAARIVPPEAKPKE